MSDLGIVDRYERFVEIIGISHDAEWLWPPATHAELATTEAALGFGLPADLRELLSVHNGGALFDSHEWLICSEDPDVGLVGRTQWFHDGTDEYVPTGSVLEPGPRALYVAGAFQFGILYDIDDRPGRLLYFDVLSDRPVIPLARDLMTLMDCYIDLAEAGYVSVGPIGPEVDGSDQSLEEVRSIFVRNRVAHALMTGTDTWLAWPGSANLSID